MTRKSTSELAAGKQRAFQILQERPDILVAPLAREIGMARSTVNEWVQKFKEENPALVPVPPAPVLVSASDFAEAILKQFAEKSRELLESQRLNDSLRSRLDTAEASVKYLEEHLKEIGAEDIKEKLEAALATPGD